MTNSSSVVIAASSRLIIVLVLLLMPNLAAQETSVPHRVRYAGVLPHASLSTMPCVTHLTFSLFVDEQGGNPLWSERQNVTVDANGKFEVLLGSASAEGLPQELFSASAARWLGIKTESGEELPRVPISSSFYSFKSSDSDMLGGLPASAFLLSSQLTATQSVKTGSPSGLNLKSNLVINTGSPNYLAKFLDSSTLTTSSVAEGTLGVGLDVSIPTQKLDIYGRMKLRARGSATSGLWLTDLNGAEQLFLGQIGLDSTSPLGIWHGGAWRFALTNTGNVGLGVGISPTARLDISGRAVLRADTQGSAGMWLTSADGIRTLFVGQRGITSADSFGIWHNSAWRFTLDKNGNVGIGVDPQFRMDILGRMRLRASGTQPAGTWFSGQADTPQAFLGQTDVTASAPIGIMHGGNWRFLLRSDGKIGIGTTNPSELLDVAGNLKLSGGGKLVFSDGTSLSSATSASSNISSTDPAIVVTSSSGSTQLSLANGGITAAKLSPNLPPTVIAGVAATLGPNTFLGSQSVQGSVAVSDQLSVKKLASFDQIYATTSDPLAYTLTLRNTATTDSAVALRAETNSTSGVAISAVAVPATGSGIAIHAYTNAPQGQGIYSEASRTLGSGIGVHGVSRSAQGIGVKGEAVGTTGPNYGLVGITSSDNGSAAVYAQSKGPASSSKNYGVFAETLGSYGIAVFGHASSMTGQSLAIAGLSESPNGVAGDFTSTATGANIIVANNVSRRVFRVETTGNVYALGSLNPGGADYAEIVSVNPDTMYSPGDVIVIDQSADHRFALSQKPYSTNIAGVYSTRPGILGSRHPDQGPQADEIPLAMVGIVPCHVTNEGGPIHRGDLLVSASKSGHAMRGTDRSLILGAIVGKALEDFDGDSGTIEILVTLQ